MWCLRRANNASMEENACIGRRACLCWEVPGRRDGGVRVGKKGERDPGQRAGGGEWGTAYNAGIGGGGEVGSGANKSAPGCQRVEHMERAQRANHGDCCQERGFGHRRAPKSFFKKRQGRTDGC